MNAIKIEKKKSKTETVEQNDGDFSPISSASWGNQTFNLGKVRTQLSAQDACQISSKTSEASAEKTMIKS